MRKSSKHKKLLSKLWIPQFQFQRLDQLIPQFQRLDQLIPQFHFTIKIKFYEQGALLYYMLES